MLLVAQLDLQTGVPLCRFFRRARVHREQVKNFPLSWAALPSDCGSLVPLSRCALDALEDQAGPYNGGLGAGS
jgi:hypothetical protein